MPRKGTATQAEMVRNMTDPKLYRPRGRGVNLETVIENGMVHWTCPVCGHRNSQKWYGREYHVCIDCEQPTSIKGASE